MKAKVVKKRGATEVEFKDLETGDWFLFENCIYVKSDHLTHEYNAISFDDDMDPIVVDIGDDEKVTPINVTISY